MSHEPTMDRVYWQNQRALAWAGPAYVLIVAVGLIVVSRFIPPPEPGLSATDIAHVYADRNTSIRIGLFMAMTGTALLAPFSAAIAAHMLRQEDRRRPVLAYVQLINGGIGSLVLMVAFMFMIVAAFDPARPADITKALNQLGWICLVIPYMPFCIQYGAIATAIFQDRSENPVFPRWVAYYNLWIAMVFLPTGMVGFFYDGPFAWDGAIAFWVAVAAYAGWFFTMTWAMLRDRTNQTARSERSVPDQQMGVTVTAVRA